MTKTNEVYEELVSLGLPKLPSGYSFKFYFASFTRMKHGYTTIVDKKIKDALQVSLRKHYFGIPISVGKFYIDADELGDLYGRDNYKVLAAGLATKEELESSREWLPVHYVFIGQEAWNDYVEQEERKERIKATEARRKASVKSRGEATARFRNRRLP